MCMNEQWVTKQSSFSLSSEHVDCIIVLVFLISILYWIIWIVYISCSFVIVDERNFLSIDYVVYDYHIDELCDDP